MRNTTNARRRIAARIFPPIYSPCINPLPWQPQLHYATPTLPKGNSAGISKNLSYIFPIDGAAKVNMASWDCVLVKKGRQRQPRSKTKIAHIFVPSGWSWQAAAAGRWKWQADVQMSVPAGWGWVGRRVHMRLLH